ncbi:hypothetical protein BC835DRAFT_1399117 [Cytidiella melzeri]|nr:hypothetical protein BC835DRAFT_1399117 [Cytidiella melzeri]
MHSAYHTGWHGMFVVSTRISHPHDPCNRPCFLCASNLAAYNLRSAESVCVGESPQTWSQWTVAHSCANTTMLPAQPDSGVSSITLPNWATQALATDGSFDAAAALKSSKGGGWTGIQIVSPIIVGVIVTLTASALFLWYRHRQHKGGTLGHPNLRAPRRFFGLIPDRPAVRSRPRSDRGGSFSLDAPSDVVFEDASIERERSHPLHSRSESRTSLISSSSRRSTPSFLNGLATRLSKFSLGKTYQSGTIKGPGYKRVQLVHGTADKAFEIDGSQLPAPSHAQFSPTSPGTPTHARQESLPSVLDIRRQPSLIDSRQATRDSTFPATTSTNMSARLPPESEFSLGISDYAAMTESPTSSFAPQPLSYVHAASPLLPADRRLDRSQEQGDGRGYHPFSLPYRNASTDSMAYQLYPRVPPAS